MILATYPSSSSSTIHEVRQGNDGVIYCTCPGWRLHKSRMCKHILNYNSRSASIPTPIKAVKAVSMKTAASQDGISMVTDEVIRILKGGK